MAASRMSELVADYIIPGVGGTFAHALGTLHSRCKELKGDVLFHRLHERLEFMFAAIQKTATDEEKFAECPRYGKLIGNALDVLKKYAARTMLSQMASRRRLAEQLQDLHAEIDSLCKLFNLAAADKLSEVAWTQQWEEDQATQCAFVQQELASVKGMQSIISELRGGYTLIEALTELKYEIEVRGGNNTPEHILKKISVKVDFDNLSVEFLQPTGLVFLSLQSIKSFQKTSTQQLRRWFQDVVPKPNQFAHIFRSFTSAWQE